MSEEVQDTGNEELFPRSAGERLRAAREARGLTIEQLAAETRIPVRHLVLIESGDYEALPGRTYAVGFSRSYAKAVGLDEAAIVASVKAELEASESFADSSFGRNFEPGDPARVPGSGLAWITAVAALLLVIGGFAFFRSFLTPSAELPSLLTLSDEEAGAAEEAAAPAMAADTGEEATPQNGAVVFTSLEDGIWVKFYDADGRQLMQKQMAKGETYQVPEDANGPQLWTGRPDALTITVGGVEVAKLADGDRVMKDVPVTAEALLNRSAPPEDGTQTEA